MEFCIREGDNILDILTVENNRDFSVAELYRFFDNILKTSSDKKMKFYAHLVLEYLACRCEFKKELSDQRITIEPYYHYNKLFSKEFQEFEIEINRFLKYLPHIGRIIRPWTPKEKGIIISNFIGCDKRYNCPSFNSWSEEKKRFLKKNYYIFNHSCCKHIHHVGPVKDIDLLLVSDEWKKKEFNEQHPDLPAVVLSDAFFVRTDVFTPKDTKKIYDLIYITRMDECKRNELLLKSLANLKNIKCLLVVAGYRYDVNIEKNIRFLIDKFNLDVDIKISLSRPELIKAANQSKIAINLSVGSIDRSVLELLSMNIPLVYLKDNPCGKDLINSQTGILVHPSPENIAKGINKLLKNRNNYSPRKWVLDNYGLKLANKKLKDAVKKHGYGSVKNVKYSLDNNDGSCVGTYL